MYNRTPSQVSSVPFIFDTTNQSNTRLTKKAIPRWDANVIENNATLEYEILSAIYL